VAESPRWLIARGRVADAVGALAALRGAPVSDAEVKEEATAIVNGNAVQLVGPSAYVIQLTLYSCLLS